MFETHPYLTRDESDRQSAIARISSLPGNPILSESLVRKRIVGQIAKARGISGNYRLGLHISVLIGSRLVLELKVGWQKLRIT
jgi:hypothetical protein